MCYKYGENNHTYIIELNKKEYQNYQAQNILNNQELANFRNDYYSKNNSLFEVVDGVITLNLGALKNALDNYVDPSTMN